MIKLKMIFGQNVLVTNFTFIRQEHSTLTFNQMRTQTISVVYVNWSITKKKMKKKSFGSNVRWVRSVYQRHLACNVGNYCLEDFLNIFEDFLWFLNKLKITDSKPYPTAIGAGILIKRSIYCFLQ